MKWSGLTLSQAFTDFVQAGSLRDITGLKQGMGLKVTPYATILTNLNNGKTLLHPGFDLSYKLTPSTTALLTVNTDFAEAQVDDQLVNIGRFPLFFPEKRAFFLQDASVFSFGGIAQSPLPFYSRRIGFVRGEKKDILTGFKVTGREGPINFGVLDVQMYDDANLGAKNLAVARVLANVLGDSTAGFIVTHGDPSTTGDSTLFGGDFNFRYPHVFGDHVIRASVWAMDTLSTQGPDNPNVPSGVNANDYAVGVSAAYPNDDLGLSFYAARYGANFRPALGFIQIPGSYEIDGVARYRWRTKSFIRRYDPQAYSTVFLNLDGSLKSLTGGMPGMYFEDQYGDALYVEHTVDWEVLSATESVANMDIPAGSYPTSSFYALFTGSPKFVISPIFEYLQGGYFNGSQRSLRGELDFRPSRHFLFSASYQNIKLTLPVGVQIVQLARLMANVIFSPQLSWNNIVQFDSQLQLCGLFSRIRYEISPGQEAFLVVNQGFDVNNDFHWTKAEGNLSIKLGMTYEF